MLTKEAARYVWPQLRAVEHTGIPGGTITNIDMRHSILAAVADLPEELRAAVAKRLIGGPEGNGKQEI